jgi:hypothetical protein
MRSLTCLLFLALVLGFAAAAQASETATQSPQAPAAAETLDAGAVAPVVLELPDPATALGLQPEPIPQACEPGRLTFHKPSCNDSFCNSKCRQAGWAGGVAEFAFVCMCDCFC